MIERSDGTQVIQQPMLVATRSYSTQYEGETIQIRSGVSRVSHDHAIARDGRGGWKPVA